MASPEEATEPRPAEDEPESATGRSGAGPAAFIPIAFGRLAGALRSWRQGSASEADDSLTGEVELVPDEPEVGAPFANSVDFNPLPQEPDAGAVASDAIFAEIGRLLRERREMLSLTYEEIERHTHLRASFLKGLEAGQMEGLPSLVQTRGILANYCKFIDLDTDEILLRFADGIQARHRERRPNWPPRTRAPMTVHRSLPPLRAFIASDLLFGGGAAIMLILFAVWGITRVLAVRAATPARATAPSISDVLANAAIPTVPSEVTLIAPQNTPLVPPTVATQDLPPTLIDPSITVQVKLTSTERTYLRVIVDDAPMFEGRTEPGKDYYYQAVRQVEIIVGNGAALTVSHNGRSLGLLGGFGEVVDRVFTAGGVWTPTATAPPTSTPTLVPTETLRPTPTLATFTPTPKGQDR